MALKSTALKSTALKSTALKSTALKSTALKPTALKPTALKSSPRKAVSLKGASSKAASPKAGEPITAPPPGELRLRRRTLILVVLLLPLSLSFYGFVSQQFGAPSWPLALAEKAQRGRILARDGTILAEGAAESRDYPQGRLAAHLVGFSGRVQADGRYGLEGLEYSLDETLQRGEDVTLTLDPNLQAVAQAKLAATVEGTGADNGSVVILEALSGRILAAASYPDYDPNLQAQVRERERIVNKAFMRLFEPGSVMKPFVVAALLESGRLGLDEAIETPMHRRVGAKTFSDVVQHEPVMNVWDVLRYSSNSGMIHLSERLGDGEQKAWLEAFGFNRSLEVPGAFTRSGELREVPWYPQDKAAITIGQSLSATTLELAAAYSIFANDGLYLPPYLVEGQDAPAPRRVLSPEVAMTLRALLRYTAEQSGVKNYPIGGVSLAGKTGTADIFDPTTGSYLDGDYNLTYAGIFPADKPELVMVVTVQKPRSETMSTLVAVPLFTGIAREAVALWQLPTPPESLATSP